MRERFIRLLQGNNSLYRCIMYTQYSIADIFSDLTKEGFIRITRQNVTLVQEAKKPHWQSFSPVLY